MKKIIIALLCILAVAGVGLFLISPKSPLAKKDKEEKTEDKQVIDDGSAFEDSPDFLFKSYGWIEEDEEDAYAKELNEFSAEYLDVLFKSDLANLPAYDTFNSKEEFAKLLEEQGFKNYSGDFKIYTIKLEDPESADVTLVANVTASNAHTNNSEASCYAPISFSAVKTDGQWVVSNFNWQETIPDTVNIKRIKSTGQLMFTNENIDELENYF